MENKPIVIFCTTSSKQSAREIAAVLVQEKLAACCNIIDGLLSVYRWEGEVQNDDEVLLIVKSTSAMFDVINQKIMALHPYDTPEIIGTEFGYSNSKYLNWIIESVGKK